MEIKKLNYSVKPWRLIDSEGYEIRNTVGFDHPILGNTLILESLSGATRKECESNAMALLQSLYDKHRGAHE